MKLWTFLQRFSTDVACRAHLESVSWPEGPACDQCGSVNEAVLLTGRPATCRWTGCKMRGHHRVTHPAGGYARTGGAIRVHTNITECFFRLVKRAILGICYQVSPEHLHRYAPEYEFRWNTQAAEVSERIARCLLRQSVGLRLRESLA